MSLFRETNHMQENTEAFTFHILNIMSQCQYIICCIFQFIPWIYAYTSHCVWIFELF